MHLTTEQWRELRKLLNKAWDARDSRDFWDFDPLITKDGKRGFRYRDVNKILKEAEEKEAKP